MEKLKDGWIVNYNKNIKYSIQRSENIFELQNRVIIGENKSESNRFIVLDKFIYDNHLDKIEKYFKHYNINYKIVPLESSEKNKNIDSYMWIFRELDEFPINRRSEPIIAIGGGVVGDLVGFVSSCYRRGIPHIKIPTTLMAYIDASIGIKTGINFDNNKNRMGSFEAPYKVILDRSFFRTLPERHILNGVGEIIKIAVIKNKYLFSLLEKYGLECIKNKFQDEMGEEILNISIHDMIEELEPNLYETKLERCVDFGHTFSLALEMGNIESLLHGEAVVIDVIFSSILSRVKGLLNIEDEQRIINLVKKFGLPCYSETIDSDLFWESIQERTLHRDGFQRIPIPTIIGKHVFSNTIKYEDIDTTCRWMEEYFR